MVKLKFFAQFLAYQCSYPNIPIFYILFKSVYDLIRLGRFFIFCFFVFVFLPNLTFAVFQSFDYPCFYIMHSDGQLHWWVISFLSLYVFFIITSMIFHLQNYLSVFEILRLLLQLFWLGAKSRKSWRAMIDYVMKRHST